MKNTAERYLVITTPIAHWVTYEFGALLEEFSLVLYGGVCFFATVSHLKPKVTKVCHCVLTDIILFSLCCNFSGILAYIFRQK